MPLPDIKTGVKVVRKNRNLAAAMKNYTMPQRLSKGGAPSVSRSTAFGHSVDNPSMFEVQRPATHEGVRASVSPVA